METVAAHALGSERARQGEFLGQRRFRPVKGSVETGDLRELRRDRAYRADGGDIVRLVQGRERDEVLQRGEYRRIDKHGLRI